MKVSGGSSILDSGLTVTGGSSVMLGGMKVTGGLSLLDSGLSVLGDVHITGDLYYSGTLYNSRRLQSSVFSLQSQVDHLASENSDLRILVNSLVDRLTVVESLISSLV
jgi:hypothetical protein